VARGSAPRVPPFGKRAAFLDARSRIAAVRTLVLSGVLKERIRRLPGALNAPTGEGAAARGQEGHYPARPRARPNRAWIASIRFAAGRQTRIHRVCIEVLNAERWQ